MNPSTPTSRNLVVDEPQAIPFVYVRGESPFPVMPVPYLAEPGIYRAELDPATHTATITPAPEEAQTT